MLIVKTSPCCFSEKKYIAEVLFNEFLGIPFQLVKEERDTFSVTLSGDFSSKELLLPDCFFKKAENKWLKRESLPNRPLAVWDVSVLEGPIAGYIKKVSISDHLPVLFGEDPVSSSLLQGDEEKLYLGIDIFGSAFFMLTRYEEAVEGERDEHGRFPARTSLTCREGFLERPIINEYLEILWACLKFLWPGLVRRERKFRVFLTHDVDHPFMFLGASPIRVIKSCGGDLIKRKDFRLALRRARSYLKVRQGKFEEDLYYTFRYIMDLSEKKGFTSAFYFKTGGSDPQFDAPVYSPTHPWVRSLVREIKRRGHEVGFHPSYASFDNAKFFEKEAELFWQLCEKEKIDQDDYGGRQHYLRWEAPDTWQRWEDAGFDYDSTVGYADHVGFRGGVCYEYPVYNLKTRQPLRLRERPLIVMEGTALEDKYMGLTPSAAKEKILSLAECCRRFNGDFVLLWHNSYLVSDWQADMYRSIVESL